MEFLKLIIDFLFCDYNYFELVGMIRMFINYEAIIRIVSATSKKLSKGKDTL